MLVKFDLDLDENRWDRSEVDIGTLKWGPGEDSLRGGIKDSRAGSWGLGLLYKKKLRRAKLDSGPTARAPSGYVRKALWILGWGTSN